MKQIYKNKLVSLIIIYIVINCIFISGNVISKAISSSDETSLFRQVSSKIKQTSFTDDEGTVIEEWNVTFGGKGTDCGYLVHQTDDDGFLLLGETNSYGSGMYDIWLIKTDHYGRELWNMTVGGIYADFAHCIQSIDTNYIIVGGTFVSCAQDVDVLLIKIDGNGNVIWEKTIGGTSHDKGYALQVTDYGYLIVGETYSYGTATGDIWILKTDFDGNELCNSTIGGYGMQGDIAYAIEKTSDDGYVIAGGTWSYGSGYNDVWLIKIDTNGLEQWNRTFGGDSYDQALQVKQTNDDGFILIGETWSFSTPQGCLWVIKTDNEGNEQWNTTFGGHGTCYGDVGTWIEPTSNGYILTGLTYSFGNGHGDLWVIKTDDNGDECWNRTFGNAEYDKGFCITQTRDGGYVVTGYLKPDETGIPGDVWLIKLRDDFSEFTTTFLIGTLSTLYLSDDLFLFTSRNVWQLRFLPIKINHYTSNEPLAVKNTYLGIITEQFIVGLFSTAGS
jgi:hypothetical protein